MNPLKLLPEKYSLVLQLLAVFLIFMSIYACGWHDGKAKVYAEWNAEKLAQAADLDANNEKNRKKENELNLKVIEAQNEHAKKTKKLSADYDAARGAVLRLHDTVTAISTKLPTDTASTSHDATSAALELLGECAAEYQRVAEAADGHASDAEMMRSAWPE